MPYGLLGSPTPVGMPNVRATPGFDPRRLGNLLVWLDGADSATLFNATTGGSLPANNGGIGRWEDKSGNGNHATQGTASQRPLRLVAAANGRDCLLFGGSSNSMIIANDLVTTAASVVVVARRTGSDGLGGWFYSYTGAVGLVNHHPLNGTFYDGFGSSVRRLIGTFSNRTDRLVWAVSSGSTYVAYLDGVQRLSAASTPVSLGANGIIGNNFFGEICEILIYGVALSFAQISYLYGELKTKWGAT